MKKRLPAHDPNAAQRIRELRQIFRANGIANDLRLRPSQLTAKQRKKQVLFEISIMEATLSRFCDAHELLQSPFLVIMPAQEACELEYTATAALRDIVAQAKKLRMQPFLCEEFKPREELIQAIMNSDKTEQIDALYGDYQNRLLHDIADALPPLLGPESRPGPSSSAHIPTA